MWKVLLLLFSLLISAAGAFSTMKTSSEQLLSTMKQSSAPESPTRLMAWFPNEGMEAARGSFPLWLFGAAGSGGVARSAIPAALDEFIADQKLKEEGESLGGPTIGLSPLIGYPRDLCIADVDQIVNNPLSIEQIVQKYPIPKNFLSSKGYLAYEAFRQANADANPLTVKIVFDSFGKRSSVEPAIAQARMDEYKNDRDTSYAKIKNNLLVYKLTKYSALIALLFLLGLADLATATDVFRGWFPDWPGGQDFPTKLLTADGNPFTIPQYWTPDVPEGYEFIPKN